MSGKVNNVSEQDEKREIEILRELQDMSNRWFSQEEFERLYELTRKYAPKGKYNERTN